MWLTWRRSPRPRHTPAWGGGPACSCARTTPCGVGSSLQKRTCLKVRNFMTWVSSVLHIWHSWHWHLLNEENNSVKLATHGVPRNVPTLSDLSLKSAKREEGQRQRKSPQRGEEEEEEEARMGPRELWLLLRIYCPSFITTHSLSAEMLMLVPLLFIREFTSHELHVHFT